MKELIRKISFLIIILIMSTGCSFFGIQSEEQIPYEVLKKEGNKEIRKYSSYLAAETTAKGTYKEAQRKNFRTLANYIFKGNKDEESIAMTSPVTISKDNEQMKMTFMMPSKYKEKDDLPKALDKNISFRIIPSKYMAAIQYSGYENEEKNKDKAKKLKKWLKEQKEFKIISPPIFAGYNPPWTLFFLRRNEVLIELEKI